MLNHFIPDTLSLFDAARARVVLFTCLAISIAALSLVLYWIITKSLEETTTIYVALVIALLMTGIIFLVKRGHINSAAWALMIFTALLNLANMSWYGIGSSASAGYIIAILLAAFTISASVGIGSALAGSVAVFIIAWLASVGRLKTDIPYQISNLTFDAPTLTLIFLLIAGLAATWNRSFEQFQAGS